MPIFSKLKAPILLLFSSLVVVSGYKAFSDSKISGRTPAMNARKTVTVNDNGLFFNFETNAPTVSEFLEEKQLRLAEHDLVIPGKNSLISGETNIEIRRAVKIKIEADGKTTENWTLQNSVGTAIAENNIILNPLDKVTPNVNSAPRNNELITITRINIEEKTVLEDIDFKTSYQNDSKLGWREEKITQAGEKGTREIKYRVTYKNGREISRTVLEKNVVKEPVSEIVVKGSYVKLGKADNGQGTWYAFKGGLFAASTTLPRGSYAKVTNTANGKSVVVQINDYGPFGKGRIIDLDKVAFQKLAPLGAGVINVKVEPILN